MKTGAISIVRNAADLVALVALHHHLLGADTVWLIDNGSSDGTYELLRDLAAKVRGLRVDRDDGPFDQARMAGEMANALLREGHRLIIPFDSDECWDLSIPRLARFMRRRNVNAVSASVVNYLQARSVRMPTTRSWRTANRRVERPVDPGHIPSALREGRYAFAEVIFSPKMVAAPPAGATVVVAKGAHWISFEGRTAVPWRRIACLHLPLRAASELEKRVNDYSARNAAFMRPQDNWLYDYWADMLASGRLDQEWAANAYAADGTLDVFGRSVPTIHDDRLVRYLWRADLFLKATRLPGSKWWVMPTRVVLKPRFTSVKSPAGLDMRPQRAAADRA